MQIGHQTLINDDYKNIKIPENSIIVIDPPFNIGYHYNKYKDNEDAYIYIISLI